MINRGWTPRSLSTNQGRARYISCEGMRSQINGGAAGAVLRLRSARTTAPPCRRACYATAGEARYPPTSTGFGILLQADSRGGLAGNCSWFAGNPPAQRLIRKPAAGRAAGYSHDVYKPSVAPCSLSWALPDSQHVLCGKGIPNTRL